MEDEEFRALTEKFMEVVPFMGLNCSTLLFAAKQVDADKCLYFLSGNVKNFLTYLDSYVTRKALLLSDYTVGGISGRIESVLWNRVLVYSDFRNYRIFLNKKFIFASNPLNTLSSLQSSYRLADDIWYVISDTSIGFTFYTKRATLAALNGALMMKLSGDYSYELSETRTFLRKSIKNIVAFSKAKNRLKSFF